MLHKLNSRRDFHEHLNNYGCNISYSRIGRIERDEDNPSIVEINAICSALNMSSDWWLRGEDISSAVILKRLDRLTNKKRRLIMLVIDEMDFGFNESE